MGFQDNVLIKTPYKTESYTPAQAREFAKCSDPVTGPEYFLDNFFYIQHPLLGKIKYQPFPYQRELAQSYHKYRFSINLLGRQLGKCFDGNTTVINIRNDQTGVTYEIPAIKFYEWQAANAAGTALPDISTYETKSADKG